MGNISNRKGDMDKVSSTVQSSPNFISLVNKYPIDELNISYDLLGGKFYLIHDVKRLTAATEIARYFRDHFQIA